MWVWFKIWFSFGCLCNAYAKCSKVHNKNIGEGESWCGNGCEGKSWFTLATCLRIIWENWCPVTINTYLFFPANHTKCRNSLFLVHLCIEFSLFQTWLLSVVLNFFIFYDVVHLIIDFFFFFPFWVSVQSNAQRAHSNHWFGKFWSGKMADIGYAPILFCTIIILTVLFINSVLAGKWATVVDFSSNSRWRYVVSKLWLNSCYSC